MVAIPYGQMMLSLYGWISMCCYLYLVCKLLQWRRKMEHFKSSYYLLFLLQSAADFYMFIFIEIVMRPRKFNFFNLFSENMQGYALFSLFDGLVAKGALCCGHIIIALNRFTTFYMPFRHEKIWTKSVTTVSILSLWGLCIVVSLPAVTIYRNSPKLILLGNGILQLYFGEANQFHSYTTVVIYVVTVVVCSILYICSYQRAGKAELKNAKIEQRLFLCAVASSFPFLIEVIRSAVELLSSEHKNDLFIRATEFWFYEMEVTVTVSVWLQLLINKNVRHSILRDLRGQRGKIGTTTTSKF